MEIKGDDPFRIRSYRRAAEAIEGLGQSIADIVNDQKALLAIPGIGKGMCLNLQEIFKEGKLRLHSEQLEKYRPTMLELLKIQGLGPKTISLIWDVFQISDLEGVEKLAREGKLRSVMQVDVRLLPPESFVAAMQYFTGSKNHNVSLRQRALRMGFTLNEYGLATLDGNQRVAGKTEDEIYAKLGLDCIPPEMRENCGEIELAAAHKLPALIEQRDIQGDVHMHTVETDGRNTIEEMAEAARARGYKYMAITDHSKNLAFANGLDDKRAVEHITRIRKAAETTDSIRIFAGIEVDILADGTLDLSDSVLEQMDIVIASVHSHFNQTPLEMTDRLLKAIDNQNTSLIGHPTGRILLRRDAYGFDLDAVLRAAAQKKVAMELNAYPDRLDLCDRHLRRAKELGVKIVINTDSHHTTHMEKIHYGVVQARRAWLTKDHVLHGQPAAKFGKAMKHEWN